MNARWNWRAAVAPWGEDRAAASARLAQPAHRQQDPADHQARGDDPGEECRPELLAGNDRKGPDVPEHDRAQEREQRSQDRVADLHRVT